MGKNEFKPIVLTNDVKAYIQVAVNEGIEAGLKIAKIKRKAEAKDDTPKFDPFKATEERLYALPTLYQKVEDDKERLKDLGEYGPSRKSADMCRFQRGGLRLSQEEIVDTLKQDLIAKIAADEYEIETIQKALAIVKDDPYYKTLSRKYFDQMSDKEIAEEIAKDRNEKFEENKVWRNRSRLVQRVSVRLYGVDALRKQLKPM